MKRLNITALCALAGLLALTACNKDEITTTSEVGTEAVIATTDTITVTYSTSGNATVSGASSEQTVSIDGNGVTIVNTGSTAITYRLSGSTSNGYLKLYSGKKQQIALDGVSITNPAGAAINVQGPTDSVSKGKAVYLMLNGNNTLADGSSYTATPTDEDEKAALFSEGQIIISGTGSLTVNASGKSGIVSDDYVSIQGGTVTVNSTASTFVTDGDTTKVAGIKGKDSFIMTDGTLTVNASGTGAKGLSGDGTAQFAGGTVTITVTGSNFGTSSSGGDWGGGPGGQQSQSDNSVAAKGMKFDGAISITGGTLSISASHHEAIESKSTLTISGGYVYATASDDAINAASDITITGGYIMAHSTDNDGIDANGNMYIEGGNVLAISAGGAEVALDANTEQQKQLYIRGGNIVAIGGLEQGASVTGGTAYQASSFSQGTWYALCNDGAVAFAFRVPSASSMGSPMAVYTTGTTTLLSGVSGSGTALWNGNGYTSASGGSSVTLSSYSSGNGGGPGGGGGGHH